MPAQKPVKKKPPPKGSVANMANRLDTELEECSKACWLLVYCHDADLSCNLGVVTPPLYLRSHANDSQGLIVVGVLCR